MWERILICEEKALQGAMNITSELLTEPHVSHEQKAPAKGKVKEETEID